MLFERVYDMYRVMYRCQQSKKHDRVPDEANFGQLMNIDVYQVM